MKKIVFYTLLLFAGEVFAQKEKVKNLPKYDYRLLHFGFSLGINHTDFIVHTNINKPDSVYIVESSGRSGFNLGIVSDLRLGEYFNLRFIPSLSFVSRHVEYTFSTSNNGKFVKQDKAIESTFLEFPLSLKYKSARLNNFRAYLLGGVKYSIDMASQKNVESNEIALRINRNDFLYEIGAGFDFYLVYFKFSPEIKYAVGIPNILVKKNNIYSNSLKGLNTKAFIISFTFE